MPTDQSKWWQEICLLDPKQRLVRNSYDHSKSICFFLSLRPKRWHYNQLHPKSNNWNPMTTLNREHLLNDRVMF